MSTKSLTSHVSRKKTKQTEPILGEPQVQNNAGGYVYQIGPWDRLARFLVLGTDGGTYYVSEKKLTQDNAKALRECLKLDPQRTVNEIVTVSDAGRAPKNDPAILALAIVASDGDVTVRALAYAALPKVCRIPTHLFKFLTFTLAMRGWSRGLRTAVKNWYGRWPVDQLAYELVKYQQREGFSNRDVFRMAHPAGANAALLRWAIGAELGQRVVAGKGQTSQRVYAPVADDLPAIIGAFEDAKKLDMTSQKDRLRLVALIEKYNLTREMVPTEALGHADIWEALLERMPLTAMIRNLGKMSSLNMLSGDNKRKVLTRLQDADYLKKSRVHPMAVLVALKTYAAGHGDKGKLSWTPVQQVADALDSAFYKTFDNVEPTHKRIMLALDISGSMGSWGYFVGVQQNIPLSPREVTAAMALITANVESDYEIYGFCTDFRSLKISPKQRMDTVTKYMEGLPMGGTDCALPMVHAREHRQQFDAFVVYTDSETWAGKVHPPQALKQYRQQSGIAAKHIVVGVTATDFTIADPNDPLSLDVVGFDTTTPQAISEFIAR